MSITNGCGSVTTTAFGDATAQIIVRPRPTGVISGTTTICNGSSASLSIALTGTGPWSGTLSNGSSFSGSTSPITVSVSPTTSTTYTIATLSDANCTAIAADMTGSAVVTVNTAPTITCPANQTATTSSSTCIQVVTYSSSATGSPAPAITYEFTGATIGTGSEMVVALHLIKA
ncbi:MAG: hypothetical protein IPP48_13425 [Chitinophagaceae bacterium]|nr:hypothetical protein [Chitinophagaceae bacterium]